MRFTINNTRIHATAAIQETIYGPMFYRTMFVFNQENQNNALICESGYMDNRCHRVEIYASNIPESLKVSTFKEAAEIVNLIV